MSLNTNYLCLFSVADNYSPSSHNGTMSMQPRKTNVNTPYLGVTFSPCRAGTSAGIRTSGSKIAIPESTHPQVRTPVNSFP